MIKKIISTLARGGIDKPYNNELPLLNSIVKNIFHCSFENEKQNGSWCVGDRVMMLQNYYKNNVMNGEEGIIEKITSENVDVCFRDQSFKIVANQEGKKRNQIEMDFEKENEEELTTQYLIHSYAISIHRSQGSEWDYGILYFPSHYYGNKNNGNEFFSKKLLYTAITRFRKCVWCIGDLSQLSHIYVNQKKINSDFLYKRIQNLC